ncbi:15092_t:CDS:2 [Gigaspora margarita]|uniref:15092_t:CDS:1 n=1 Tax=Gigaspora margarita TaxID=4874 RepID=A0ABN7VEU5_GIGMA|nr:15092_t:CDS:2 [Gigaspora margarita]
MSKVKLSKLPSDHEKHHCNPIIYKTKYYTFWYTICDKGVFPISNLKYTRAPKTYAIPNNFSIITTLEKLSNLNTIKGYIKYIDNHSVYYVNYGPDFNLEIISNHSSSNTATKTQRAVNELKGKSENTAKENYHPDDQITLKKLSYTVANTPFQIEFGSQNTMEKSKHELEIVQIIDKYQIPQDGYHALLAIQPDLPLTTRVLHLSKPVINLRISGDGHNVGKKINHNYELLKNATRPLVDELNELQKSGFVNKNRINWSINLYFSSNWKFLALCLGINMANSINFCPWYQYKKTNLGNLKKRLWIIKKKMNIIVSNYLSYPGYIRAPLFPMIPLNH